MASKIFYIPGDFPFCYMYRGYLPGIYSNQTVVSDFMKIGADVSAEEYTKKALQADIICFQRPTTEPAIELAKLLKKKGKKIIMDNDDTYSGTPLHRLGNEKRVKIALEIKDRIDRFVKLADGITVSTQILKEEYEKINPNVVVLKNCIDPLDELTPKKNETGKFRVGLIGSVTSNDDYFHIKEQLKQLTERGDVTLVILGIKQKDGSMLKVMQEDADFFSSIKVEWHPQCFVTEYMHVIANLALDLAIIPRKDHYFNKCKSNIKYLEMSLLRIPVLAQGFPDGLSPYQQDSPFCTIVNNDSEWYSTIIDIKENYAHYKDLANKAHDYVLENFNIKTFAPTWTEEIQKLCTYQQTS
jgi:hypothetical protein